MLRRKVRNRSGVPPGAKTEGHYAEYRDRKRER
jgi:hypothetical protein